MSGHGAEAAAVAAATIRARIGSDVPVAGLILGSGLGGLVDQIERAVVVPYADVPGFPMATIAGHAGVVVAGRLAGRPVVALSGRFHMYEGHSPALAAFSTRVLHALGAPMLIVTNAAGGVRRTLRPGALMLIRDHINFLFTNPLIGGVEPGDARFPDMSEPYDRELGRVAHDAARDQRIELEDGVYVSSMGPSYETRAEVRMLAFMGADAVGMSTVPEVLVARALEMRVLGLSCITNLASGLSAAPITHAEVLETTRTAGESLGRLVREIVRRV